MPKLTAHPIRPREEPSGPSEHPPIPRTAPRQLPRTVPRDKRGCAAVRRSIPLLVSSDICEKTMPESRHVTITVRYEPQLDYGRSLAWLAPELSGAGLALTEDHLDDRAPSRTWAGYVDGATYERFARAWRLPAKPRDPGSGRSRHASAGATYVHTLDGMNWEVNGESPIIAVAVQVTRRCTDDHSAVGRGPRAPATFRSSARRRARPGRSRTVSGNVAGPPAPVDGAGDGERGLHFRWQALGAAYDCVAGQPPGSARTPPRVDA